MRLPSRATLISIARVATTVAADGAAIAFARTQLTSRLGGGLVTAALVVLGLAFALLDPNVRRWVRAVSIDQWRAIDAETDRTPEDAGRTSLRVMTVLVTVAVVLTLQEYFGDRGSLRALVSVRRASPRSVLAAQGLRVVGGLADLRLRRDPVDGRVADAGRAPARLPHLVQGLLQVTCGSTRCCSAVCSRR